MKNWFDMGRIGGGPSMYEDIFPYAEGKTSIFKVVIVAFSVMVLFAFVFFIFICKMERILKLIKVTCCVSIGGFLMIALFTSSWSNSRNTITTVLNSTSVPGNVRVGLSGGLSNVMVQMEIPGAPYPEEYFIKRFNFISMKDLHEQYKNGLREGWPWPMLYMGSLIGADTYSYNGVVGKCLYRASQVTFPCVIASLYIWILWCATCKCSPSYSGYMSIFLGFSLILNPLVYSFIVRISCSSIPLPDGQILVIQMSWVVFVNISVGLCVFTAGVLYIIKNKLERNIPQRNVIEVKDSRVSS